MWRAIAGLLAAVMALGGCAQVPTDGAALQAGPAGFDLTQPAAVPVAPKPERWHVFLVAGSRSQPVFDAHVSLMAQKIRDRSGVSSERFYSSRIETADIHPARLAEIAAVAAARSIGMADACLFYFTAHGRPGAMEMALEQPLTGARLAALLDSTCGTRPTVVFLSACYSGSLLTPELAQPNRTILTAARSDRTSFGCAVTERLNVFDQCVQDSWDTMPTWQALATQVRVCVEQVERRRGFRPPSEPQVFFGRATRELSADMGVRVDRRVSEPQAPREERAKAAVR